jgi:hypothetical protein
MGYIAHDAVLVVTESYREGGLPDLHAFRSQMPDDLRRLVIGPVETAINSSFAYAFLPDGSKEGWKTSDEADEWRDHFRDLFRFKHEDGSSPDDVVSIRFGGDFGYESAPVITEVHPHGEVSA